MFGKNEIKPAPRAPSQADASRTSMISGARSFKLPGVFTSAQGLMRSLIGGAK